MADMKKIIEDLSIAKCMLISPQTLSREMHVRIGQAISAAITLLKEQEQQLEEYHKADTFLASHGWKWEGKWE